MKPNFEREIAQQIKNSGLIAPGDRLGMAVSGGADSVAMLRILDATRAKLGITLTVVHFDHQLREDSAADSRFVEELALSRGLPFIGGGANVAEIAAHKRWNIEDAARRLRYDFFADVLHQGQATRIAVAHTMDDQAETVLARMLRGCGPAGLAGIYDGPGAIIRPLLDIRRTVLRDYLSSIGQIWREDVTNQDIARQRARIREKLLPVLERDFSPRAVEQLATLARLSREEQVFWTALIEDRFEALATQSGNVVSISIVKLLSPLNLSEKTNARSNTAMRSLTERLVRRLYQEVRGNLLQLTSTHVQQVIRLAQEGMTGKVVALPGRILVTRNFERLTFSCRAASGTLKAQEETQSRAPAYHYAVPLNACGVTVVSVPELGACFRLKVIDCPSAERETTMWASILDLDTLRQPLVLRNWQPGDGYRPRGRRKKRKLKEMFLSARIASSERCRWPVLESDGNVVWARGIGPADEFSAQEGTLTGVLIEECKL